jgi:hypothetical protein
VEVERPHPAPGAAVLARVDRLWNEECAQRGGALFDGRLFSLARRRSGRLEGWFTDYRAWIAQLREPSLFAALRIAPIGVCAILVVDGGVVLGKRDHRVTLNAGLWELVPSGGLDESARDGAGRIDVRRQLESELTEELNVDPGRLRSCTPFAVIADERTHVSDVVVELELEFELRARELLAAFEQRRERELTALRVVRREDLAAFFQGGEPISPFALEALRLKGWCGPGPALG